MQFRAVPSMQSSLTNNLPSSNCSIGAFKIAVNVSELVLLDAEATQLAMLLARGQPTLTDVAPLLNKISRGEFLHAAL